MKANIEIYYEKTDELIAALNNLCVYLSWNIVRINEGVDICDASGDSVGVLEVNEST
jgi:hypothetical protein